MERVRSVARTREGDLQQISVSVFGGRVGCKSPINRALLLLLEKTYLVSWGVGEDTTIFCALGIQETTAQSPARLPDFHTPFFTHLIAIGHPLILLLTSLLLWIGSLKRTR